MLCQTLDLLNREQVLQLHEAVQEANADLMHHISAGCVTALSDVLGGPSDLLGVAQTLSDVHDLQVIHMIWGRTTDTTTTTPTTDTRSTTTSTQTDDDTVRTYPFVAERYLQALLTQLTTYSEVVGDETRALQALREEEGVREDGSRGEAVTSLLDALEVQTRISQALQVGLCSAQRTPACFRKLKLLSQGTLVLRRLQDAWLSLWNEYRTLQPTSIGFLPSEEGSVLAWFSNSSAAKAMGLLEECFDEEEAPVVCTNRVVLRKRAVRNIHKVAVGEEAKFEGGCFVDTLLLLTSLCNGKVRFTEPYDIACSDEVQESDFQTVTYLPYYKGVYTLDGDVDVEDNDAEAFTFAIDGQEGKSFLSYPTPGPLLRMRSTAVALLVTPDWWIMLNAIAIAARVWWK